MWQSDRIYLSPLRGFALSTCLTHGWRRVSVYRGRDSALRCPRRVQRRFKMAELRGARSVPPAARGRGRRSAASLPTNHVRTVNTYGAVGYVPSLLRSYSFGHSLKNVEKP